MGALCLRLEYNQYNQQTNERERSLMNFSVCSTNSNLKKKVYAIIGTISNLHEYFIAYDNEKYSIDKWVSISFFEQPK